MNERIKEIRESLHLSRAEFGKILGVSGDVINNLERGRVEITDERIKLICSIMQINEKWLRTGEGDMKLILTKNQEIAQFLNDVMAEDDEDFKKNFIEVLASLDEKEWTVLASITRKLVDDFITNNNDSYSIS